MTQEFAPIIRETKRTQKLSLNKLSTSPAPAALIDPQVPRTHSLAPRALLPSQEVMSPAAVITTLSITIIVAFIANTFYRIHLDLVFEFDKVNHKLYICQQIVNARINYV
ncbi:hypothetical protein PCASD_18067 [Puccinia coronata f. sp. avenae]|uniref:Uncharacterized protein n=1 Tax=Puccinia coronata f. sp. avenae TaxID=200324 RepID=A0A2N5U0G5_9BASI|nr:hypothetical protein PCASD_18067 [Puccinia coronata f. sp. avenae]